jgi:hypothetical protein
MKKGDRVINIENYYCYLTIGKIYTVEKVKGELIYIIDDQGRLTDSNEYKFELVDEFKPTKSFLKDSIEIYGVMMSDGTLERSQWVFGKYCIDENLKTTVKKQPHISTIFKLVPVWKRDERPEITIEEAQEKYGFRLKEEK